MDVYLHPALINGAVYLAPLLPPASSPAPDPDPTPNAGKVPDSRIVVFGGGTRVVAFEGGTRTVRF